MPKEPKCKYCLETGHYAIQCLKKPRKPIQKGKAINRIGPVTAKWIETRHQWIQKNTNKEGTWVCYLQITKSCPKILTIETLTLDHVWPRGSNPKLRFDMKNLKPACFWCNKKKGSLKPNHPWLVNRRKKFS